MLANERWLDMGTFAVGSPNEVVSLNNQLLNNLPEAEYRRIQPHLEPVDLNFGSVLFENASEVNQVDFIGSGLVSLVAYAESGAGVEVACVGCEGIAGTPILTGKGRLPYRGVVRLAGRALRMRADVLRQELEGCRRLRELLLLHAHGIHLQACQLAVCNRFHSLHERLCRWLLTTRDHAQEETFPVTQEFLASMLGATRVAVTVTLGDLQRSGLVSCRRGRISILDRKGLQKASCECYWAIKESHRRLLDPD